MGVMACASSQQKDLITAECNFFKIPIQTKWGPLSGKVLSRELFNQDLLLVENYLKLISTSSNRTNKEKVELEF